MALAWLAARLEGIGLGWVSILDPAGITETLGIPESWRFVAGGFQVVVEQFGGPPDLLGICGVVCHVFWSLGIRVQGLALKIQTLRTLNPDSILWSVHSFLFEAVERGGQFFEVLS